MSEEKQPKAVDRRKRVQRLKKIIVSGLLIGIIVPWIGCIALFALLVRMRQGQDALQARVDQLTAAIERQGGQWEAQVEDLTRQLLTQREKNAELEMLLEAEEARETNTIVNGSHESEKSDVEETVPVQEDVHKVYLTFDDGPSVHTNEILDILKAYDIKATFFVLGKEGDGSVKALQRIVEEGHSLGMHSYDHQYDDIYSSKEAFAADFQKIQDYLFQVTGVTSRIYRFPGGSSNTVTNKDIHEFIDYLDEQNTVYFDWNVSSGDAAKVSLSVETIVANATKGIETRPVSVILFHDAAGRESTVQALPYVIEKIQAMDNTVFLPITEETEPVQHVSSGNQKTE